MVEMRPVTKCVTVVKRASTRRQERGPGKTAQTRLRFAALHAGVESPFAWLRLVAAVVLSTIGRVGMWAVPVVLPAVHAEVAPPPPAASPPVSPALIRFSFGRGGVGGRPPPPSLPAPALSRAPAA